MKLKQITFTLENCEYITIDGKYIGGFIVNDISTSIRRVAMNAIMRMDTAYTFAIEIHKDANKEKPSFGYKLEGEKPELIFERLVHYDDITSIRFELVEDYVEDGQEPIVESYDFYVHWIGNDDYENEAQKSYISSLGNLYIVIADGKNIDDFFNKEEINDAEHMDFVCSMYDIGDKYSNRKYNMDD